MSLELKSPPAMTLEQESRLVELLALVYNAVDWGKMKSSYPYDVFNHRVRAAARRSTLYQSVSKLSNYFGLQSIPTEAALIVEELRPIERLTLNKLYTEHVPICMRAVLRAKIVRKEKIEKKKAAEATAKLWALSEKLPPTEEGAVNDD